MADAYPTAIDTVDVVLMTLSGGSLRILASERPEHPFRGLPCLPGGYLRAGEDASLDAAAIRVLRDKEGLDASYLEQLMTFSGPDRDPRGWSISHAYYALVPEAELAGRLRRGALLLPVDDLPPMGFDHACIAAAAVSRVRGKSGYTTLPLFLLPDEFTLSDMQAVYRVALGLGGIEFDDSSFRRRVRGFVAEIPGRTRPSGGGRPHRLYRMADPELAELSRTSVVPRAFRG